MKSIKIALFLALVLSISSCATLSKEQCASIDWKERGKSDAMKGLPLSTTAAYEKACGKHGLPMNRHAYEEGRSSGLKLFCEYETGLTFGKSGKEYLGVCSGPEEKEFLRGYQLGHREYLLDKRESELRARENSLRERESILTRTSTSSCTFSSDCKIKDNCSFGKCERTGNNCTFSSDCETQGRCSTSTMVIDGKAMTGNYCKYD